MRASRLAALLVALARPSRRWRMPIRWATSASATMPPSSVEPDGIRLRYLLDLAEIPTFQTLQAEGLAADAEDPGVRAYLTRTAATLADGLTLELDGQRLGLRSGAAELILPPGAGGLPTLKLAVTYRAALPPGSAGTTAASPTGTATIPSGRAGRRSSRQPRRV